MATPGYIEKEIIALLDERSGASTAWVSARLTTTYCRDNARQRSVAVRAWLLDLRSRGLVRVYDDQKPVLWALPLSK